MHFTLYPHISYDNKLLDSIYSKTISQSWTTAPPLKHYLEVFVLFRFAFAFININDKIA